MSVRAAYRASMEGGIPSKEDVIWQRMCKEWIWEFLLKHCCNSRLLRDLARAYPVPDSSLHLKRLLLLKSLAFDLSESNFTDRTVETMSALCSHYHSERHPSYFQVRVTDTNGNSVLYPFSLSMLHLAVRVECTVQYLRPEIDDWPKFYESVERHWGNDAEDTEEPEHTQFEDDEAKDAYLKLKEELWAVLKQSDLRHDLLKMRKREYVVRMIQSFLSEAWKDVGVVFLEGVALNIKQGLYVPDGSLLNRNCVVREEAFEPEKSSSVKYADMSMVEGSCDALQRHAGSGAGGQQAATFKCKTNAPLSSFPENCSGLPTDHGSHGQLNVVKSFEKEPDSSGRPSVESPVNVRSPSNCREDTGEEQTAFLLPMKRIMPVSLQGKETGSNLPSCDTDSLQQTNRIVKPRFTRPSDPSTRDVTDADGPPSEDCQHINNVQLVSPGEKGTYLVDVNKQRNEGGNNLEEEEQACISPPPWAGSPALNEIITVRKRPILAPPCPETIERVSAVCGKGALESPVILKAQIELKNVQASLNAVVQDPLPEALTTAEEASKISSLVRKAREHTSAATCANKEIPSSDIADLAPAQDRGAIQGPQEKRAKNSIMERNPTAHTIEWETGDDNTESCDDRSPSNSRHVRLPKLRTMQNIAQHGGIAARNEPKRRKFRRWNLEEENVLRKEVERYGKGLWKHILQKHKDVFEGRTEVDLKDKWRNIERREGIL